MKHLLLLITLSAGMVQAVWAQAFCASDDQATPVALIERFTSADCAACWSAPQTLATTAGALTLDWIVPRDPSDQPDEAPLSAAASPDARLRLDTLGRAVPTTSTITIAPVDGDRVHQLRVAQGTPLGGYIGASIELKTNMKILHEETFSAWLVLVETLPAGTEGSPIERNLVRNVLLTPWNMRDQLSKAEQMTFHEMRPLSIPPGATPERLRVVGWIQDARGRVVTAAQSVCAPSD